MDDQYLDIRTLNFIIILFSCIYSVCLLCYQYSQSKIKGLNTFSISLLFLGLGPFFLGLRGIGPDWLTIVVSNTFILVGFLLSLYSVSIFRGFPLKLAHIMACFIPLVSGLLYYYSVYEPSIKTRIICHGTYLSVVTLCSAIAMLRGKNEDLNLPVNIMAFSFACYSAFMVGRTIWTMAAPETTSFMHAGLVHQLAFLFGICLIVALSFSMLWLINARLVLSINNLSQRDALTGLYNRRALEEIIPRLICNAIKQGNPVSIIMADIDRFKAINDHYGHTAGDQVMEKVAKIIKEHLPESACAVRVGGDEFMMILLEKVGHAKSFAENIRTSVENESSLQLFDATLTMSLGISELEKGASLETALTQADIALYHSKHTGRNQVTLFSQDNSVSGNLHEQLRDAYPAP
ncbi:GGDEF domain-containing protein [Vibrio sp. YIC-376]|uniref:GGDEF domain-containing protein n=1 Tax=Vibrio sp. YIC-376 TaxID=3136162 RepID=UPI00402A70CD